ncbi:hypothetical protein Patl1_10514 [Pistacia atlantica]|uniref:Uncharacterized protein n=1 Tax=Pistacia atlantica TaxID=434234 RepID=A0ACC1A2I5_9ROSI|nr:hypothetical protein Patl1_10514 [Pistacia atlantica]
MKQWFNAHDSIPFKLGKGMSGSGMIDYLKHWCDKTLVRTSIEDQAWLVKEQDDVADEATDNAIEHVVGEPVDAVGEVAEEAICRCY